jgi:ribosomal protein S18 acetylase RimI-like enzyme
MQLFNLTQPEYDFWSERSIREYKKEQVRGGLTETEAEEKSQADFKRYLPDGLNSPDQYLFTMKDNNEIIGYIWFCERGPADNRKAYLLDIIIEEQYRGKGYGKKAMLLLEEKVKYLGLKHIGLHVFGHNNRAYELYKKLGYVETNIVMEKVL